MPIPILVVNGEPNFQALRQSAPGKPGFSKCRLKPRRPRVHALVVTAYPTDASRTEATNRRPAAYLTKPLDLGVLLKTFQTVLAH
jgi:DNA-binding NarL/FixJ family response regulator